MRDSAPTALTPSRGRSLLELLGLSGLTVTQPVLSTFGDSPDFFVFREATRADIAAFALAVAVVPGLVAWLVSVAVGLASERARGVVHHAALAGFTALGVLQVAAAAGVRPPWGALLGLAAGIGLVVCRLHWSGLRSWLSWLAPAPLAFAALFLFASPVSSLVTGGEVDPADLGPFGSGDPPPVVVMVFDEWPLSSIVRTDGTIDEAVAPNVARLARRATWYRDTTTVANITNFAVPPILTGNMPVPGDRPDASNQPENLFTLLGGTYDLRVEESLTRMCPGSLCAGDTASPGERAARLGELLGEARRVLASRLDPDDDDVLVTDGFVEPERAVRAAEQDEGTFDLDELLAPRPERLDDFIGGMRAGEDPTLHYVHVLGPHTPHRHTPGGVRYPSDSSLRLISTPDGSPGSDLRAEAAWAAELDRQRLLLEVGYVDQLLGDVLDRLEATGLYDDALVVLTSDHGLAFEPGATARGLGEGPVEREVEPDLLWVPLLVKAPGQLEGRTSDLEARTIDILPTMAGHLGIDLPWEVDGRDLEDPDAAEAARVPRRFVRIAGNSFAVFSLEPPVAIRADVEEVIARGTDAHLVGSGPDRWWRVGPRPELAGTPVAELQLATNPVDRHVLDDADAYRDVDVTTGEAPLLISGRVEREGVPRTGTAPVAVLVGDVVGAVVPTYEDGDGPGRFAAVLPPELFAETDGTVRVADVTEENGATALRLIPER